MSTFDWSVIICIFLIVIIIFLCLENNHLKQHVRQVNRAQEQKDQEDAIRYLVRDELRKQGAIDSLNKRVRVNEYGV